MIEARAAEIAQPQTPSAPEEPPMEIHKPKPVHSWREFLTELGTIVLGICIALAGEEVINWNHWRTQVQEAKAAIATEMTYNLVGAFAHMRSLSCVEQRLDALSNALDEAERTGSLPPVGNIGGPVRHGWQRGAWDSVVASQTSTHFGPQQLAALGSLYRRVERADDFGKSELQSWTDLYAMVGPGKRLDPASVEELRKTLIRARDASRTVANVSRFMVDEAVAVHLPFSPTEREQLSEIKNRVLTENSPRQDSASMVQICAPIGAVPSKYGEAPEKDLPARMRVYTKTLPDFGEDAP
jgi:hypothetical protein